MQPKITGKDIQGVPKIGALSELSFCKPGLRARGLPLPVACSTGSEKPIREDLNREKTFSFGHCPNYLNQ